MNRRPLSAALSIVVGTVSPLSSWAASVAAVPQMSLGVSAMPAQTAAVARLLNQLPAAPTVASISAMPAAVQSQLAAASLLAAPQIAAVAPGLAPAALPIQEALRQRPELAAPLAKIREELFSGRLAEAAQALGHVYDLSAALAARELKPAAVAAPAAPSRVPALAPSRPDWTEGVFLPKTIEKPLAGDALGVTVHRLANGLTVYLSPNKQEPRVSFEIAVRAGSRSDPLEATGMAHYLEHMQFKGTQRLGTIDYAAEKVHLDRIERLYDQRFTTTDPAERAKITAEIDAESQAAAKYAVPNEVDKLLSSAGFTEINAHTSVDETSYQGSFPSNRADLWAKVETEVLAHPVYRIFLPELEAVYEEFNKDHDVADGVFFEAVKAALFKGHPYARDIIGLGEHLKNPSISRMRRFFSDHYHPNNMAVILSGDFDRQEMLARIDQAFGALQPAKIPAPPAGQVRKLSGVERAEVRFQAEEAVVVAWQLPPKNNPDKEALALAGRLFRNLLNVRVNTAQKLKGASAGQVGYNEAGGWFVDAAPKEGQTLEQAEQVLMDEVARFKAGDFTDEDLQTAVAQLEVEKQAGLEKNGDRVAIIRQSFIAGQEWASAAGALEKLKSLTKADVLRAANRYLGEDRLVVYRRKGDTGFKKVPKPVFTPVPIDTSRQSAAFKELSALPAEPVAPRFLTRGRDYETADRPWGRLYATRNRVNDLFNIEFKFDRGLAQEKRLDAALALMQVSGAGGLSAEQFQKTMDRLGSGTKTECGERECTVTIYGLEKNLEETLRLTLLRFEKPNVPAGAFGRAIDAERGAREDRKLDPEVVRVALREFVTLGKDSPTLKGMTPAELDALTENDLKFVLGAMFDYRRDVLYTGSRGAAETAAILTKAQPNRRFKTAPKSAAEILLKPARPRVVFVHKDGMQQAVVGAYAADGRYDADARLDYNLYNAVMGGGLGGVYFQEVRESRALAYTAGGAYEPADRPGDENMVWSRAGTQADKAVQTAKLMLELMARPPLTPERYALARKQVEEAYRTTSAQLEDIPRAVRNWERLGFKEDPRMSSFRKLSSYSPERLVKFMDRFRSEPLTLYVLGDRGSVDVEGLKKLGDFEERGVDELFPY